MLSIVSDTGGESPDARSERAGLKSY